MCWFTILLMGQEVLTVKTHMQQRFDTLELKLVFDVAPGMHVYAPSSLNQSQGYIIMKLEIDSMPEGLQLLPNHQWPEPEVAGGGEVYTGNGHTIMCRFIGKAKKLPGEIKGVLYFQACNEEMCFPPDEKEFKVTLQKQLSKKQKKQQP
jgi:thiol:disulfide interchange protein